MTDYIPFCIIAFVAKPPQLSPSEGSMASPQFFNYLLFMAALGLNNRALAQNTSGGNSTESPFPSILVGVGVVGLIVLFFLFIIYYRKTRKLEKEMRKMKFIMGGEEGDVEDKVENHVEVITERSAVIEGEEKGKLTFVDDRAGFELNDLLRAPAEGLGKGNFGNCYKAQLDDRTAVVVKRLRDLKPLTRDEFVRLMQAIADMKHPNLLPLLAYYYSIEEKLLITKYASTGNVYNRIHGGRGTKDRIPFRWTARLAVARGVAQALEYLHSLNPTAAVAATSTSTSQALTLPHGNLKSTNVLLSENDDTVLVSDYGLASVISLPIASHRMSAFKSPEFQSHKRVSPKSDVWTYGCLLLELLTARISSHAAPNGTEGVDLGRWVHRAVREEWTAEIFDVEISAERSANQGMVRLLQVAVKCCDKSPEKRPDMAEVVREVEIIKVVVESEEDDDEVSVSDDSSSATPATVRDGH